MNNNDTNTEKLIRYIDGETDTEATAELEHELTVDLALREELENLLLAKDVVKHYGLTKKIAAIRVAMLPGMIHSPAKKTGIVKLIINNTMKIAAGIILIAGLFLLYQYTTVTSGTLYAGQYTEYSVSTFRGSGAVSTLEKAYNEKNYSQVITTYEQLPVPGIREIFLAGQAFLLNENYPAAVKCFTTIIEKNKVANTSLLSEDASYYLALTYLKANQPTSALPIFKQIHDDKNHLYNTRVSGWFIKKLQLLSWKS